MKKILIVLTNTKTYGQNSEATGLWLGEATEFIDEISKYEIEYDFVSPKGGMVPIDPRSLKYAKKSDLVMYETQDFKQKALLKSLKPSEVNAKDYWAIYFTGGHGVMWDFPHNKELQKISLDIYNNQGYIATVCHGIAGLLYLQDSEGNYLIANKKITGFTTTEEKLSGKKRLVPFLNQEVAKEHGAKFVKKRFFSAHAVQDGQLITGQNPQSVRVTAKKLLKNL
ncbi:type 1 glutamine amidotransferase domain-containing protein [Spiroplasma culicicola]|uniref:ThiJ/PfpI family protein n=1 Tax=Spiroplasma culicicola AES-1 TaxID=1276246 RepID=W6A687_9MOLU|nr:type 1 glutamine amidotransferase domain-containing protein [Spiroplasma culicicola]AHI52633.1 ThiJ/PfpI family protein [Spiroplasma culicicola AES-1]